MRPSVVSGFTAENTRDVNALDLMRAVDAAGFIDVAEDAENSSLNGVAVALQDMLNQVVPSGMQEVFDQLVTLQLDDAEGAMTVSGRRRFGQ